MKNRIFFKTLVLVFSFTLITCSKSDNLYRNCEVVINADGPGFLKIVNKVNSKINVFLPEYAFAAIVRVNTCEIYGLNTGMRRIEISICTDNDCNSYSNTKKSSFLIEDKETHTIEVTEDFFNN